VRKPVLLYLITRPDLGGAQSHVLDLIRAFREDYETHLAVGFAGPLTRAAQAVGIPVHLIPALVRQISPHLDIAAVAGLVSLFRLIQPDLVHAHSSKAGMVGRMAAKFTGIPAIFTAHGWAFSEGIRPGRRLIALAMEQLASGWAERLICVSDYDYRLALRLHVGKPAQMCVVKYGLVAQAPAATPDRPGTVSLAMVARFGEQKDHATLIRGMAHLKPGTADLNLIGEGERRPACEQLARDLGVAQHIRFWGDRLDVPELLADCHMFVLCTHWEGLPISILEAIRAGLPVVATAVSGVPELVGDGETGFLIPRKDPSVLAQALQRLIENPRLRAEMGQQARARFLAHFTLDRMMQQIQPIYREAV